MLPPVSHLFLSLNFLQSGPSCLAVFCFKFTSRIFSFLMKYTLSLLSPSRHLFQSCYLCTQVYPGPFCFTLFSLTWRPAMIYRFALLIFLYSFFEFTNNITVSYEPTLTDDTLSTASWCKPGCFFIQIPISSSLFPTVPKSDPWTAQEYVHL